MRQREGQSEWMYVYICSVHVCSVLFDGIDIMSRAQITHFMEGTSSPLHEYASVAFIYISTGIYRHIDMLCAVKSLNVCIGIHSSGE